MIRIELKSVDSTNIYAKKIANKVYDNAIIISEKQTAGYGTKGTYWYADENSIICSFLIKNRKKPISLNYSYKIGIIVSNVINEICDVKTYVKEPNDIYLNNKKLGGILIETQYLSKKLDYVIIGIGLNINQETMPKDIINIATSLYIETKKKFKKEDIIDGLIKEIESEEQQ